MNVKRRGLGRNLSDLLSITPESFAEVTGNAKVAESEQLKNIPLEFICRGKYQPRKEIDPESLQDLAASIKAQGLLQPIVLRPLADNQYEIIAGERRWRAAQLVGLDKIPALIKNVSDEVTMALALIENMQRQNLSVVEEAVAIQRLISECTLTHQEVADALGKSRTAITNILRIMSLCSEVRQYLENGDIELGHAKVLLALTAAEQKKAAQIIIDKNLSVRETENLVKRMQMQSIAKYIDKAVDPDVRDLQTSLGERLGAKVFISYNKKGKGKLVISYNSLDELEGILEHIQ